jgi:hypothetical protein
MRIFQTLLCSLALAGLIVSCAHLAPGADPLVVRVEQGLSTAATTFMLVLHEDQAERSFWMTNAPAFHTFCEWLRTPIDYQGSNHLARCDVMQLNIDDLKLSYKEAKTVGNSNALYTAFAVFNGVVIQATSWKNIVRTPIHP